MQPITTEVLSFLSAFISHWQSYATGGTVTALIGVGERLSGKSLPKKAYFMVFVVSFSLVGFFMAWREQYERAEKAERSLGASGQRPIKVEVTLPKELEAFLLRDSRNDAGYKTRQAADQAARVASATKVQPEIPKPEMAADKHHPVQPLDHPATAVPPPPVESLRFTQRSVPSTKQEFPYAIELVVQTNVEVESPSLVIECKGEIGELRVRSETVLLNYREGYITGHKEWGIVGFSEPKLVPAKPLVIVLLSKELNTVLNVRRIDLP